MDILESFDPGLFGVWPEKRVYDGRARHGWSEDETREAVEEYFLETKSSEVSPGEELRVLLNQMTAEMRDQFAAFRDLRKAAEITAADGADEAAGKLAACAARSFTLPGATNWRNGNTARRPGTCCSSVYGSGRRRSSW
jgi:hypothetical protein